jgi:hypothetical protein
LQGGKIVNSPFDDAGDEKLQEIDGDQTDDSQDNP